MKTKQSQAFKRDVWQWYWAHTPGLPWRMTRDPYRIFVSEVMLQQTQIPRVLEAYPRFLQRFPTLSHLAAAPFSRVLKEWQGMGYNRRALYLKKAARIIEEQYQGKIPRSEQALHSLPGIGAYSARAILCFAYGDCKPFVETNIRRVIIHTFFPGKKNVSDEKILLVLQHVRPQRNQREWYWALMDYGRDALKHIPNPNRRSKGYMKQSRFEGSPRYTRAKIIQYLLKHKKAAVGPLARDIASDRNVNNTHHIPSLLISLVKEGLIQKSGRFYSI